MSKEKGWLFASAEMGFLLTAVCLFAFMSSFGTGRLEGEERPAGGYKVWPSEPPADCPFPQSAEIIGVGFTEKYATYHDDNKDLPHMIGDTWYPSWAADDKLYSPWTDGFLNGVKSASWAGEKATTGHAAIVGDDPLHLTFTDAGIHFGSAAPYSGRYPCANLVYNGVWYIGTYCLNDSDGDPCEGLNWDILGPFVGFRYSTDSGKTWTDSPHTPERPLFGEPDKVGGTVKMGVPHVVDFGKNMQHSPDGKAYLVCHGAMPSDPKPRPANLSWVTGDQIYMARVLPSPENMNDATKYEFFAGHDAQGTPIWTHDFSQIKPLIDWNNNCGGAAITYNPGLKKYLMCVNDGGDTVSKMNTYILESDLITGPWKLITYMKNFGEQAYFANIPSKFISADGRTAWLCYSANFTNVALPKLPKLNFNPPAGHEIGECAPLVWQEIKLLSSADAEKREKDIKASASVATPSLTEARSFYLRDIAALKDYRSGRVTQCPFAPSSLEPSQTVVLLDLEQSGFLTHVWTTGHWKDEWISFYFDGEEKPSIEGKCADVFAQSNALSGTIARLPIALQQLPSGGLALNCYIPMPFKRSVKVTLQNRGTEKSADIYFIFDHILRPANDVPDCRLQRDPKTKRFSYVGPDAEKEFNPLQSNAPKPASSFDDTGIKQSHNTLKPGEEKDVIGISGAGIVDKLTLECNSPSAVKVRIFYDNSTDAAIDCRLDKLFGMRSSMILEHEGDNYSFYLPMPYRKHWKLSLKNTSDQEVSTVASIAYRQTASLPAHLAYLHAAWNSADGKESVTYPLFSASGRGHFVGMLLYQPTSTVLPSDHAGADFIYGDASTSHPFTLRANGGEDYFSAAYFGEDYATPFVGATKDYMHGGMRYRFHLESPIAFTESINVDFAQFQGNSYESVAFWYQDTPGVSAPIASIPWRCLGPFDPDNVPDEVKNFLEGPNRQLDFDKTYSTSVRNYAGARFERRAKWRSQIARGGFVDSTADDVIPVNGIDGSSWIMDSVWYAMTHLTLAKQEEITLLVGHDDPIDVYIDGKLTVSWGGQAKFGTGKVKVSLAEGKHRIVVKSRNMLNPATFFWDSFSLILEDSHGRILPTSDFSN